MNTTTPPIDDHEASHGDTFALAEVGDKVKQAEAVLADLNERATTFVREHPGVCIAGALAVGYLVGRAASKRWLR